MHGNHVPINYARFPFPFDSLRYTVQKEVGIHPRKENKWELDSGLRARFTISVRMIGRSFTRWLANERKCFYDANHRQPMARSLCEFARVRIYAHDIYTYIYTYTHTYIYPYEYTYTHD